MEKFKPVVGLIQRINILLWIPRAKIEIRTADTNYNTNRKNDNRHPGPLAAGV